MREVLLEFAPDVFLQLLDRDGGSPVDFSAWEHGKLIHFFLAFRVLVVVLIVHLLGLDVVLVRLLGIRAQLVRDLFGAWGIEVQLLLIEQGKRDWADVAVWRQDVELLDFVLKNDAALALLLLENGVFFHFPVIKIDFELVLLALRFRLPAADTGTVRVLAHVRPGCRLHNFLCLLYSPEFSAHPVLGVFLNSLGEAGAYHR